MPSTAPLQPDTNGLYNPASEAEIIALIAYARQHRLQVRVRGAAQSVPAGVFTTDHTPGVSGAGLNLSLNQLRTVSVDAARQQATVGGGCNLGFDPYDPSGVSAESDANNLLYQLNQHGLALPNVPDAIHQTVAGFIATGSSGGSMQHSFDEHIIALRLIDGTGTVQVFTRSNDPDNPFFGAVVSMGLLGIVTQVTLQCVPAFAIGGTETVTPASGTPFHFTGPAVPGQPPLTQYLAQNEFARLLWWPYSPLQRVITWTAHTLTPAETQAHTDPAGLFQPQPYQPLFPGNSPDARIASATFASTSFQLIATWPTWFYDLLGVAPANAPADDQLLRAALEQIFPFAYPLLTDLFFPCSDPVKHPPQQFWDTWLGSLPMDTFEFSNNLFSLSYTELWVPVSHAGQALAAMQQHYQSAGYSATSFYTVEIAGAKSSPCWLSPAYNTDAVRFNIMFFRPDLPLAQTYFTQFWDLFRTNNIPFRLHWGKSLPTTPLTAAALPTQYPKLSAFLALRTHHDPDNLFLTQYWQAQLNIAVPANEMR